MDDFYTEGMRPDTTKRGEGMGREVWEGRYGGVWGYGDGGMGREVWEGGYGKGGMGVNVCNA